MTKLDITFVLKARDFLSCSRRKFRPALLWRQRGALRAEMAAEALFDVSAGVSVVVCGRASNWTRSENLL